jgi:hypothetical protein
MLEAIGGRVSVESELQHGSTFTLHLPTRPREETTRRTDAQTPNRAPAPPGARRQSEPCPTAS